MTTVSTLSAQEKIEYLATKVMGWEVADYLSKDGKVLVRRDLTSRHASIFDPLTDWNHWRQVEEKVMEDEKLAKELFYEQTISWTTTSYVKADLPTRVDALIAAHQSL